MIDFTHKFSFGLQQLDFCSLAAEYPGKHIHSLFPFAISISRNDYEIETFTKQTFWKRAAKHIENVLKTDGKTYSIIKIKTMMIIMTRYICGIHGRRNSFKHCCQQRPFPEFLAITNPWHTVSIIRACSRPKFWVCCM